MLILWPSLLLLAAFVAFIVLVRFVGGRVTLGFGFLMLCFTYGAVGASILNLAVQRLALFIVSTDTASWAFGPLFEEAIKAIPILLLAYGFVGARRLSVADFALIGVASGIGFEFAESNLSLVLERSHSLSEFYRLSEIDSLRYENDIYWCGGHALWTGFVGLGVGLGLQFWPNDARKFAPPAACFALAWFEHTMWNWKGAHTDYLFGQIQSIAIAPRPVELLYWMDLRGLGIVILFPLCLLAAVTLEGWRGRAAFGAHRDLMLPDEGTQPLVPREWMALAFGAPRGRVQTLLTARYFRRRRELGLTAVATGRSRDAELAPTFAFLTEQVRRQRAELDEPHAPGWIPSSKAFAGAVQMFLYRKWVLVLALVVAAVLFAVPPGAMPDALRAFLYGPIVGTALVGLAATLLIRRIYAFQNSPRPAADRADGERLAGDRLRALMLGVSVFSLGFSILALLLRRDWLAPGATAFITTHWVDWLNSGGGPSTLAVGPLVGGATADPTPPQEGSPRTTERPGAPKTKAPPPTTTRTPKTETPTTTEGPPTTTTQPGSPTPTPTTTGGPAKTTERPGSPMPPPTTTERPGDPIAPLPMTRERQGPKEEFEALQKALKEEAGRQLAAIDDFYKKYNTLWSQAMRELDAYLHDYQALLPDLKTVWEAFGDRKRADNIADWIDLAIQSALIGTGMVDMGGGAVAGAEGAAGGDAAAGAPQTIERVTPGEPEVGPTSETPPTTTEQPADPTPTTDTPATTTEAPPTTTEKPAGPTTTTDTTPQTTKAPVTKAPRPTARPQVSGATRLRDALKTFYGKAKQPPLHVTDRQALNGIVKSGFLEAPMSGASWSYNGILRDGDVALRLTPGAEQYIELVSCDDAFGQVPHYYPEGVGVGEPKSYIPTDYLEYFNVNQGQWLPLKR